MNRWIVPRDRIIPACAGNSPMTVRMRFPSWDHPRVCGEQISKSCIILSASGSSPRVRGTDCWRCCYFNQSGIIPACAGNSNDRMCQNAEARDHPRVCGEQVIHSTEYLPVRGSSPRVRGTGTQHVSKYRCIGIIPACAGNSLRRPKSAQTARDHPRVCGEQWVRYNAVSKS